MLGCLAATAQVAGETRDAREIPHPPGRLVRWSLQRVRRQQLRDMARAAAAWVDVGRGWPLAGVVINPLTFCIKTEKGGSRRRVFV